MLNEIDLIPADYRRTQMLKHWGVRFAIIALTICSVTVLGFGVLRWSGNQLEAEKLSLEQQLAVTTQQRNDLEGLVQRRTSLENQLTLLQSLRSGSSAEVVFAAIDEALTGAEVWFTDWKFRRAGALVSEERAKGVETGYFIIVPDASKAGKDQAWLVETHMTINGQASDHEALSRFVQGLYAQSAVVKVSVQGTELRQQAAGDVVNFELAIVLNSEVNG